MGNLASTGTLQHSQERVLPANASSAVPAWAQIPGLELGDTGVQNERCKTPQVKIHIAEPLSCPALDESDPEDGFWQKGFWHIR